MKRYLAIDPGEKRTGLAVGDDLLKIASPLGVIHADHPQALLEGIAGAITEHAPDELVIGIPLNMDGTAGPVAEKARALSMLLAKHTGLVVHEVDERLSSFAADEWMKQSGLTHKQKKARRDALAATAILRDFLACL
jgi:putative Holliday junction resolvase